MHEGMDVNTDYQIQIMSNKLAQMTIREVQLEAAVQQLLDENGRLKATMDAMIEAAEETPERED